MKIEATEMRPGGFEAMLEAQDASRDREMLVLAAKERISILEQQLVTAQAEIDVLQEVIIRLVGSEQGERLLHKCRVIVADKARRK